MDELDSEQSSDVDGDLEERPLIVSAQARPMTFHAVNHANKLIEYCCIALFLLPSIVGVAIASQYNAETSVCNDGTKYTVDLDLFLYVGGGSQIFIFVLNITCDCICSLMCHSTKPQIHSLGTFIFVWIIIGLVIYCDQISFTRHYLTGEMMYTLRPAAAVM
eukprot:913051_1